MDYFISILHFDLDVNALYAFSAVFSNSIEAKVTKLKKKKFDSFVCYYNRF